MQPELLEKLAGRKVIASVSGGKDSAALALFLMEQGIEHERVFMDTGWEHQLTYDYLRGPLTAKIGTIRELHPPRTMEQRIRHGGMFSSRGRKWCTKELKLWPLRDYLASLMECGQCRAPIFADDPLSKDECECGGDFRHSETVNANGIRAEESNARAAMKEWEWSSDLDTETWRPLIAWTLQNVIDIHARHGLKPNPLYMLGATRVGCWPCINAKKSEIKIIAETDPARIALVAQLEMEVSQRRGAPRAFFNGKTSRGSVAPIEDVAAWAKGDPRQLRIVLDNDDSPGCMRWGLCETSSPEAQP